MPYILALDQGTTSSRAILFDTEGRIKASAQYEFPQYFPHAGYVEHEAEEIYQSEIKAVRTVLEQAAVKRGQVLCVGVTNQRETTIVWEKASGKPVHRAIVWQCRRTAPLCEQLLREGLGPYISEHTGLLIDAYFSATKLRYILDAVPNGQMLAENGKLLFGTVDSYLVWKLTGAHITDYSNASRTMLFDIHKLDYDELLLRRLNIPRCMLPTPRPSAEIYGRVKQIEGLEAIWGVSVSGAVGDQQGALFGQACFEAGQAKCTYGTGGFLMMHTGDKPVASQNSLLTTIAWGLKGRVSYALEGSIFHAGSAIKWLRDELGLIKSAAEIDELAASVSDAGGAYFVSAFTGLGAPHWDMYARGAFVGLTRGTTRAHFARAVLEGIVYQITELSKTMEVDSGFPLTELKVDGGVSVSDVMLQFQADMLKVNVNRPKCVESTALGAAYLAGLGAGVYGDTDEIATKWHSERIFAPNMDDRERSERIVGWNKAILRAKNWEES